MSLFHENIKQILSEVERFLVETLQKESKLGRRTMEHKRKILDLLNRFWGENPAMRCEPVSEHARHGSKDGIAPVAAADLRHALHAGFLERRQIKGSGTLRGSKVKQCWCVLHQEIFYYFNKQDDKKQVGAFEIEGYTFQDITDTATKKTQKGFWFELYHDDDSKNVYQFKAKTKEDFDKWRDLIDGEIYDALSPVDNESASIEPREHIYKNEQLSSPPPSPLRPPPSIIHLLPRSPPPLPPAPTPSPIEQTACESSAIEENPYDLCSMGVALDKTEAPLYEQLNRRGSDAEDRVYTESVANVIDKCPKSTVKEPCHSPFNNPVSSIPEMQDECDAKDIYDSPSPFENESASTEQSEHIYKNAQLSSPPPSPLRPPPSILHLLPQSPPPPPPAPTSLPIEQTACESSAIEENPYDLCSMGLSLDETEAPLYEQINRRESDAEDRVYTESVANVIDKCLKSTVKEPCHSPLNKPVSSIPEMQDECDAKGTITNPTDASNVQPTLKINRADNGKPKAGPHHLVQVPPSTRPIPLISLKSDFRSKFALNLLSSTESMRHKVSKSGEEDKYLYDEASSTARPDASPSLSTPSGATNLASNYYKCDQRELTSSKNGTSHPYSRLDVRVSHPLNLRSAVMKQGSDEKKAVDETIAYDEVSTTTHFTLPSISSDPVEDLSYDMAHSDVMYDEDSGENPYESVCFAAQDTESHA